MAMQAKQIRNSSKQKRGFRVSNQQHELFLDFLEEHRNLAAKRTTPEFTCQLKDTLWEELTRLLNSGNVGPKKDLIKWRKTFADWKCTVKAKAARIRGVQKGRLSHFHKTDESLTPNEERLMNIVGYDDEENEDIEILPCTNGMETDENTDSQNIILIECEGENMFKVVENDTVNADEHSSSITESGSTNQVEIPVVVDSQNDMSSSNYQEPNSSNTNYKQKPRSWFFNRSYRNGKPYSKPSQSQLPNEKLDKISSVTTTLNRLVTAEQRKASAQERIAAAEERKAAAMEGFLAVFTQFLNNND